MQPFFRGHKMIECARHEPWLFGEPFTSVIREAIRRRYKLLPYIYTLFAEAHVSGVPVMRSMMYEFPNDEQTFAMDDQYMLGDALLVKPVTEKDQKVVKIYVGDQTVNPSDLGMV
jgi:alpha 1,3-glucosidase